MTDIGETNTLGQYLCQERKRRGITIEQVASATKIGVKQLQALEADQYTKLPAKPFVRGFVISYCRFIGLDPQETLIQFNPFIDEKALERPNRDSGHSGYAFEKREGTERSRTILSVVLGGFIVVGGIAFLVLKPSLHNGRHSHLDRLRSMQSPTPVAAAPSPSPLPSSSELAATIAEASPSASPSPVVSATPSPALPTPEPSPSSSPKIPQTKASPSIPSPKPSETASASPSPSASPTDPLNSGFGLKPSETAHRLVVKAKESVWVRYQVDDKPIMQFPLRAGKVLVLRCRKTMILQIGNPELVQISHNGGGYQSALTQHPITWQDDSTFIFPEQQAETVEQSLKGQKPLSNRPVPPPRAPQPSPTTP